MSACRGKRNGVSACRRVGVWEKRNGVSAGRHAWRGRVALPRDRRCTSGNFPLLITPPQPFILRSLLFACSSSMNVQRRSRGSATLPRHACRYADTPTRRHADSSLPHADPPTRRYAVSFLPTPPRSRWRYFDRSVPESAHLCSQNLGKDPHPVFVLFKSNLPLEGVLLLIMSYWTYDGGLRGSASLAVIVHFLSS